MSKSEPRTRAEMEKSVTERMVPDPDSWPMWPVLFMKRRRPPQFPEMGFMYGDPPKGGPYRVYTLPWYETQGKALDSLPHVDFGDVLDLQGAGWVVD
jgi:hypothetical protein